MKDRESLFNKAAILREWGKGRERERRRGNEKCAHTTGIWADCKRVGGGGIGGTEERQREEIREPKRLETGRKQDLQLSCPVWAPHKPLMASDPGKPPPHQGWGPISSSVKRGSKKLCKPPLLQKNFDYLQYARDRKSNRFVIDKQHAAILCNATAVSAAEWWMVRYDACACSRVLFLPGPFFGEKQTCLSVSAQ